MTLAIMIKSHMNSTMLIIVSSAFRSSILSADDFNS